MKNDDTNIKDMIKNLSMNQKEKICAQLERLSYLEKRGLAKYHEIAQIHELRRELALIEFNERKRTSSHPPQKS